MGRRPLLVTTASNTPFYVRTDSMCMEPEPLQPRSLGLERSFCLPKGSRQAETQLERPPAARDDAARDVDYIG